jgi:hypothetical protein
MLVPQARNDEPAAEVNDPGARRAILCGRYPGDNTSGYVNVPGFGFPGLPD